MSKEIFFELKKNISKEKRIAREMDSLFADFNKAEGAKEKEMTNSQINSLMDSLKKINSEIPRLLEGLSLRKPAKALVSGEKKSIPEKGAGEVTPKRKKSFLSFLDLLRPKKEFTRLEKEVTERFRKKEKKKIVREKKAKKPSRYVNLSTRIFADYSRKLLKEGYFKKMRKDLVRANMRIVDTSYISVIFFTTLISMAVSIFIIFFFLFFSLSSELPIIVTATGSIGMRLIKSFWILFVLPTSTFIFMYLYPTLEKISLQDKIETELPFATIHMSSISSSMVNPSKIFEIITSTGEYPNLEKEFKKLLNEINIYGYDLVSALKNISSNTPSMKLRELFNGMAITINSGGDLQEFFDKRAQSLLFEYRIEMEKYTRAAETFMDIYISIVIAAPMILMLLIVMMKISGLGISLSTSAITIIMVMSVGMVNIIFLTFLHLKQSSR
jgi:hypothetical protein